MTTKIAISPFHYNGGSMLFSKNNAGSTAVGLQLKMINGRGQSFSPGSNPLRAYSGMCVNISTPATQTADRCLRLDWWSYVEYFQMAMSSLMTQIAIERNQSAPGMSKPCPIRSWTNLGLLCVIPSLPTLVTVNRHFCFYWKTQPSNKTDLADGKRSVFNLRLFQKLLNKNRFSRRFSDIMRGVFNFTSCYIDKAERRSFMSPTLALIIVMPFLSLRLKNSSHLDEFYHDK